MSCIYKITNLISNKIYIGLTIQGIRTRFQHHLYEMRSGSTFPIHNALRKYGENNFTIEILEELDSKENLDKLKELEIYYISKYNSYNRKYGYNLTKGGDGTLGKYHSEYTKDLIRQKAIGRKCSEDAKQRMSISAKERAKTIEFQIWKSKYCLNPINKISVDLIKDGQILKFESIKEACNYMKISKSYYYKKLLKGIEYKGFKLV